jgi:type I restriction enzyme, S subunit
VTGAVQLKINQKALNNVKLVIAPREINNAFNKIIQSLYRSIRGNQMKNGNLTHTRDVLLPRLMSGELSVS